MGAPGPREVPPVSTAPAVEGPIGRVQTQLGGLNEGVRSAARRSRRVSWFAWGFLFAGITGIPVLEVGILLSGLTPSGPNAVTALLIVGGFPAFVLLILTVRELLVGRGEAGRPSARTVGRPGAAAEEPPGFRVSLLTVQESQKQITRIRGELEVSMIPLILGGIGVFEVVGDLVLLPTVGPAAAAISPLAYFFLPYAPLVFVVPFIWYLWRVARQWVDRYQRGLDDQVRQLISLEGEFLGRFASDRGRG